MKQEERYNATLEKVKGLLKDQEIALHAREKLANVFPELKESEDDKTRKEILNVFKQLDEGTTICGRNYDYAKWIAWLEKQGELNNNDTDILNRFSFYSYKDEPNILYLSELYVNKEQRNKGIGTKILKIADEVAANMKCNSIRLKTEIGSNAERLYRKNGYNSLKMEGNHIWLEKQGERELENYDEAEKEKADFVGDGFIECHADFLDFKEGNTYWLEYIGDDKYNVRSDNLLGKTYHITPCQLYTVFKKLTWLEEQVEPLDESVYDTKDKEFYQAISIGLTDAFNEFGWSDFGGIPIEDLQDWLEKQGKTLDPDKVIEWLKTKVYGDSTYGVKMIEQFKKDFGI